MSKIFCGFRFMTICFICLSALNCAAYTPSADKPHHTQSGFKNVHEYEENSFWDFLKWRRERENKEIPGPESYNFPQAENNPDFLKQNRNHKTLTWIGHASLLVQMEGYNILTDPHFSRRSSPIQWIGPQRVAPLGLATHLIPS